MKKLIVLICLMSMLPVYGRPSGDRYSGPTTHRVRDIITKSPWVDVRAFGATGNGVADDSSAFRKAITALPARGGTILCPVGIYYFGSTVVIPSTKGPIKFVGMGSSGLRATTIFVPATQFITDQAIYILTLGETGNTFHQGFEIENIGFADSSASYDTALGGIYNFQCNDVRIEKCTFRNFTVGTAIYYHLTEQAINNDITNVKTRNCKYGINVGGSIALRISKGHMIGKSIVGGIGVWAEGASTELSIYDTAFDEFYTGIELGTVSTIPTNINIINNRFEGGAINGDIGVHIIQAERGRIIGNTFHSSTDTSWAIQDDSNNRAWIIYGNNYADYSDPNIIDNLTVPGNNRNWIWEPSVQYYETHLKAVEFTDGDTTPDVGSALYFETKNTGLTLITDFSGRLYKGKEIYVQVNDSTALTTFVHAANGPLVLTSGGNISPLKRQIMHFMYDGARWVQIGTDTRNAFYTKSDAGAVSLSYSGVYLVTTGTGVAEDALTLANGFEGQEFIIVYKTETEGGDTSKVTPNSFYDGTQIIFAAPNEWIKLIFADGKWRVVGGDGPVT